MLDSFEMKSLFYDFWERFLFFLPKNISFNLERLIERGIKSFGISTWYSSIGMAFLSMHLLTFLIIITCYDNNKQCYIFTITKSIANPSKQIDKSGYFNFASE